MMKATILLAVIPTLLSSVYRVSPPPLPIVLQYDEAGNRISRTSSPTDSSVRENPIQDMETNQMENGGQEDE